jgi:hypothetical protein
MVSRFSSSCEYVKFPRRESFFVSRFPASSNEYEAVYAGTDPPGAPGMPHASFENPLSFPPGCEAKEFEKGGGVATVPVQLSEVSLERQS